MTQNMTTIAQRMDQPFESSCYKTEEFRAFARNFKKAIKDELENAGAKLIEYSVGHFDLNGFYQVNDRVGYFSLGDVRGGHLRAQIMFRTAKNTKDYSGGQNNWAYIAPGVGKKMAELIA